MTFTLNTPMSGRRTQGLPLACAAFIALLVSATAPVAQEPAKSADEPATKKELRAAGVLFDKSCSHCHLAPDPNHATDRAWLNQIKDTA